MSEQPPSRTEAHDRLEVFLGDWRAEGESYGSPNQREDDPKSTPASWTSSHTGRWHTGQFFLIHDERATVAGQPFATLSILGVDPATQRYVMRSFENHGFARRYEVTNEGRIWTCTGELERCRIELSADGRTQTIVWEWNPSGSWLPLCDRTARRLD